MIVADCVFHGACGLSSSQAIKVAVAGPQAVRYGMWVQGRRGRRVCATTAHEGVFGCWLACGVGEFTMCVGRSLLVVLLQGALSLQQGRGAECSQAYSKHSSTARFMEGGVDRRAALCCLIYRRAAAGGDGSGSSRFRVR
jgi:hypothetical protein